MVKLRYPHRTKRYMILLITLISALYSVYTLYSVFSITKLTSKSGPTSSFRKSSYFASNFINSFGNLVLDKSSNNEASPTLVFTCLGEHAFTKHQTYIWKSLHQARLINGPYVSIVVILSNASLTNFILEHMSALNVSIIFYEYLLKNSGILISNYRKAFFIQGLMVPANNFQFNILTTERLLAIHAYMNVTHKSDIFHMENDNMLYENLVDLTLRMHECGIRLALPRASRAEVVVSFLYIRDTSSIEHFVRFIINIFELGRSKAIEYMKTSFINDMSIAWRYVEIYGNTNAESNLTGITLLPTQFNDTSCCLCIAHDGKERIIFDARTLGQYFGGYYWTPNAPFFWRGDLFDPRNLTLYWKPFRQSQLFVPYVNNTRVLNFHVHSKRLEKFMSDSKNQTTGFGRNITVNIG